AGIAVTALGHSHPKLVAAVKDQAEKLWHTSNIFRIPNQEKLAELLTAHTSMDVCFFTNSGAEAIECAIKTARKYHWSKGEPVQGEGGARSWTETELKAIRQLCDETGTLLIYDEIQCGLGRTGRLFAYEWADGAAEPDIMAVAKALGGGFPVGACLATAEAGSGMTPGSHGSTYCGNPLAMAVGIASVEELVKSELLAHV